MIAVPQLGLGYALQLEGGLHPASVDLFTDSMSLVHVGLGMLAGSLPPEYSVLILAAFIGYQVSQATTGEPWTRTGGEFIEFALGMAAMLAYQHGGWKR